MFDVNNCVSFLTNQGGKQISESMNRCFEEAGGTIHRVAWTALYYINSNPGITQKELAGKLLISEPTMLDLAARMERDGLIEKKQSENNKKRRHLFLTDKGRDQYESMMGVVESFNAQATEGITEEEFMIFKKVMAKMIENAQQLN